MAEMPLAGRRVIVTRPEGHADALAARLRALGAEPLVVPTIDITPADVAPMRSAARRLGTVDWLVFTSANGVRYAQPVLAEAWPGGLPSGVQVAAIGPETARALKAAGIPVHFVPPAYVAESVINTLPLRPGACVLLLQAELARKVLAEGLRARGAQVESVTAYHTRPVADGAVLQGILAQRPAAVTFTSASTAEGFAGALGGTPWPDGLKSVAIGPITADTLRRLSLPVDAVAREHTLGGLLDALVQCFT